jgi:protein PhnA
MHKAPNGNALVRVSERCHALGKAASPCNRVGMSDSNDDYIYDEATGEWRPAAEAAAAEAQASEVRDASGTLLADGDSVVLIKDLKVKGAGQTLKQGTVIKTIRLTDNPEEIDCRHDAIKGLVLRTEFVRKR